MSSEHCSGPGLQWVLQENRGHEQGAKKATKAPPPPAPEVQAETDARPHHHSLEKSCSDTLHIGAGLSARETLPEGHQLRLGASSKSDFPPSSLSQSLQEGLIFPEMCHLQREGILRS